MAKLEKPTLEKATGKPGGARPGAGRPEFVPTDEERKHVEALSGCGLPFEQIAALVRGGIHVDTLRAHFKPELTAGKATANAQIGKRLFQKAMDGDTASLIWWTKTQMGWTETQKHIIENTDEMRVAGRPIEAVRELMVRRLDAARAKLMPSDN